MERTAVITGASRGIGRAITLGLALPDTTLCLVGRNLDVLQAVASDCERSGARARCYRADLTSDDDLRELSSRLQAECLAIDMLIHSAGLIAVGSVEHAGLEEFDLQYQTNVRAPFALTQALLPQLKLRCSHVVFINSTVGVKARGNVAQYAATKHALKGLADSLREEVNRDGVRVMSVFLGRTATDMQAAVHEMEGRSYHPEELIQPEEVADVILRLLELARSAEVTDVSLRPFRPPSKSRGEETWEEQIVRRAGLSI